MNNIIEIENYMLSVKLNLLNHLDREGYYVKNIYLTDMFYVITHDNECLIDLENQLYYKVKNQRLSSIGIKINDKDFEDFVKDDINYHSLNSVRRLLDVFTNYA